MKKWLWFMAAVVVLTGCGENKAAKQKQQTTTVQSNVDYIAQGMEALRQTKIEDAIQSFNNAIRQSPTNIERYLFVAEVYLRMKYYQGAVDVLNAAAQIAPQNGDVFFRMALTYYLRDESGDLDIAENAIGQSLQLFLTQKNKEKFELAHALYQDIKKKQQEETPTTPVMP